MIERPVASGRTNELLAENVVDLMPEIVHEAAISVIQQSRDAIIEAVARKWRSHNPNFRGGTIPLNLFPYNERCGVGMQSVQLQAFHANAEHPNIVVLAPGMVFAPEGTRVVGIQTGVRNCMTILSETGLHTDKKEADDRLNPLIPCFARKGEEREFFIDDEQRYLVEAGIGVKPELVRSNVLSDVLPDSGVFFRKYIFSRNVRGGRDD